jgi:FKBP-type peptidyl-prolyl cis-trans isomerase
MRTLIAITLAVVLLGLASCKSQPYPEFFEGYGRTESGLYYKFHQRSFLGETIQIGDVVLAVINFYWCDERVVTDVMDVPAIWNIDPAVFSGDLTEGLLMMQVGDSASFILPADSVVKHWGVHRSHLQHFCDYLRVTIRIDSVVIVEECPLNLTIQRQEAERAEQARADLPARVEKEKQLLQEFVRRNKVTVKPNSDGVYVVRVQRGSGRRAKTGRTVVFDWNARCLNGNLLDSSCEDILDNAGLAMPWRDYQPQKITIGAGDWLIGIDRALLGQRPGSKLRLYMPSSAIFGAQGGLFSSAFQSIILEVEVLEVR